MPHELYQPPILAVGIRRMRQYQLSPANGQFTVIWRPTLTKAKRSRFLTSCGLIIETQEGLSSPFTPILHGLPPPLGLHDITGVEIDGILHQALQRQTAVYRCRSTILAMLKKRGFKTVISTCFVMRAEISLYNLGLLTPSTEIDGSE